MSSINMLKLSQNIVDDLKSRKIEKIKIYFYGAGCSGTKVGIIESDFEKNVLEKLSLDYIFEVYIEKIDKNKFENAIITMVETTDHTGKNKTSYIYSSEEIKERCGCGSSFSFEKKNPKLNLDKLKGLKNKF